MLAEAVTTEFVGHTLGDLATADPVVRDDPDRRGENYGARVRAVGITVPK